MTPADPRRLVLVLALLAAFALVPTARAPPDSYEPDDTAAQATALLAGTPQDHSISPAGDVDWYVFVLTTGSDVVLETSGPTGDTVMTLYQSDGTSQIAMNDDGGTGAWSRITETLPCGTYTAHIRDFGSPNEILDYTMTLTTTPAITAPCVPATLTATGAGQVALAWTPPSDTGGAPILEYAIFRGTTAGSTSYQDTTTGTSWVDTNVTPGQHYYYEVRARNSRGLGPAATADVVVTVPPVQPGTPNFIPPGIMFTVLAVSILLGALVAHRLAKRPDGPVMTSTPPRQF